MALDFIPPTLNGFRALRVSLQITWLGAWVADVELDLDVPEAVAPILAAETPAILIVGGSTLIGTIDPRASSTFAGKASARVVGGRGGWDKNVSRQHFHNPAGVLPSALVYLATGAEVGEIVVDSNPSNFGTDYVRNAGPARNVFGDRNWFVELATGTTIVGGWPTLPLLDGTVLDWSPSEQRATLSSDSIVTPGTLLADLRFGTDTYTVRDVEQVFSKEGTTVYAWCSDNAASRLTSALKSMVKAFGDTSYLGFYKYRYVLPGPGELQLQAVTSGAPDLMLGKFSSLPLLMPGAEVIVGFLGGDPTQPFIASSTELQLALLNFCLTPPLTALTVTANAAALALVLAKLGSNG